MERGSAATLPEATTELAETRIPKDMVLPWIWLDLDEPERDLICQEPASAGRNQTRGACLHGPSRDSLRYRLEKYGIH